MKKFLNEFKEFAMRGSVLDLAIGIIIGASFNSIVTSLVNDVLMPPIGLILGRVNFANLFVALNGQDYASLQAARDASAPTINYGLFVNTIINFIIVAFVVFLIVRWFNRSKSKTASEPTAKDCPYCYSTIPIKAVRCPSCTSELESRTVPTLGVGS